MLNAAATRNNLAWLEDADDALEVLAAVAVEGRARRARMHKQAAGFWDDTVMPYWNQARNWATNQVVDPIKSRIGNEAAQHMRWGLAGAGIGAGIGLGGQLLADKKKRRPLSAMLTGGLLGAGAFGGGSLIAKHLFPSMQNLTNNQGARNAAEEARDKRMAATSETQPNYSKELAAYSDEHDMPHETMRDLAISVAKNNGQKEVPYETFLQSAYRNAKAGTPHGSFSLPASLEGMSRKDQLARQMKLSNLEWMERPIEGLVPADLRKLVGQGPDIDKAREEYIKRVMGSYAQGQTPFMRPAATEKEPDRTIPWTEDELRKHLPAMMQQATGPKRSYTWKPYSNAIQQQSAHRLLDEWVAKANELGSISATGRALGSMNPFERGRQIAQQVRHGQPGQGALNALRWTGLGHLIPGAAPKNEGLLPEVSRATRSLFSPTLTPETIQKLNQLPEFKGKPSHLAPQLLNAYYHGTAAQERLLNDLSREGVFGTLEPSEQQQQMQAMTNAALKGVGFNPDSIFNWTPTGSSEIDAAMALGTVDVVGSNLARLNRRFSGMPDVGQLGKAVEASGASGKLGTLNDQARKYMLNVQQAHGDAGLKAVANALRTGSELPYLQEQGLLQTLGKTEAMALSDAAQLAAARSAPATQSIAALKKQLTAMKNSGGAVVGNLSMRQIDALLNQVTLLEGMTPSVRETTFRGMLDNGFTMPGGGKKKNLIPASEIKNLARGPTPGIIPPLDSAGKWQLSGAADAAWHADVRKMLADPAARIPGMSSEIKDLLAAHPRGAEIVKQVFTDPAFKARLATNIPVTLAELNSIAKAMPKERFLRRSFAGLRGIPRWAGYLLPLIALETAVYSGRPGSSSVSEEIDYDLSSPR